MIGQPTSLYSITMFLYLSTDVCHGRRCDTSHAVDTRVAGTSRFRVIINRAGRREYMLESLGKHELKSGDRQMGLT